MGVFFPGSVTVTAECFTRVSGKTVMCKLFKVGHVGILESFENFAANLAALVFFVIYERGVEQVMASFFEYVVGKVQVLSLKVSTG